jgi:hypothetical protein
MVLAVLTLAAVLCSDTQYQRKRMGLMRNKLRGPDGQLNRLRYIAQPSSEGAHVQGSIQLNMLRFIAQPSSREAQVQRSAKLDRLKYMAQPF